MKANFFQKTLSENTTISSLRVMSFLSLFTGMIIGLGGLYLEKNLGEVSMLCGVFVGAAFGGKVGQKYAERRTRKTPKGKEEG